MLLFVPPAPDPDLLRVAIPLLARRGIDVRGEVGIVPTLALKGVFFSEGGGGDEPTAAAAAGPGLCVVDPADEVVVVVGDAVVGTLPELPVAVLVRGDCNVDAPEDDEAKDVDDDDETNGTLLELSVLESEALPPFFLRSSTQLSWATVAGVAPAESVGFTSHPLRRSICTAITWPPAAAT